MTTTIGTNITDPRALALIGLAQAKSEIDYACYRKQFSGFETTDYADWNFDIASDISFFIREENILTAEERAAVNRLDYTFGKLTSAFRRRVETRTRIAEMENGDRPATFENCYGTVDALGNERAHLAKDNRRISRCDLAFRKAKQAAADLYTAAA